MSDVEKLVEVIKAEIKATFADGAGRSIAVSIADDEDREVIARAALAAIEASGHRVVEATGMAMIDAQNRALLDRAFCMASDVAALVEAQRHEIDAMLAAAPKVTE